MRVTWIFSIAGCGFAVQSVPGESPTAADAAAFDASRCPATYNANLPGPSRYRLIPEGHPAWDQSDRCAADMVGATHLAVFDSAEEITAALALITTPPMAIAGTAVWIGGVQQRTATQPAD